MEKLYDSELKVMNPLWAGGPQPAGTLAKKLAIAVLDRQRTFQYSHGFSQPPLARRIEHIAHLRIA